MGGSVGNFTNKKHRRRTLNTEINITPLVDVMLLLLIIFMTTAPMLVAGIKVDLPKTSAPPLSGNDEPLAVDVDAQGKIYLQEILISAEELVPKLMAITKEKMDSRIFVRGDKNVDYGKVVEVISAINEGGFHKVALLTSFKERNVHKNKH